MLSASPATDPARRVQRAVNALTFGLRALVGGRP